MSALGWDSNALTSIVHLVTNGVPICGVRQVILAGGDEGGIACGRCILVAGSRPVPFRVGGLVRGGPGRAVLEAGESVVPVGDLA